jgi:predicted nucleic acid-binding Zn ribbon protein
VDGNLARLGALIMKLYWFGTYECEECGEFVVVHETTTPQSKCGFCGGSIKLIKVEPKAV